MQKRKVPGNRTRAVDAALKFSVPIADLASSDCAYPTLTLMERVSEYLDRYKQFHNAGTSPES